MKAIIVTGGAGFIGSHLVRLLVARYPQTTIVNVDALTYAGNLANLRDVEHRPNYRFIKADITDAAAMDSVLRSTGAEGIFHLAAESHVDRSIHDPLAFARTNVMGTLTLLDAARRYWESLPEGYAGKRFVHVSTDEVYGSLPLEGDALFTENTPYSPHSPYSASKASSDHFVKAYHDTYGFPAMVTNCSNNYGPNQFPEKLIPLMVNNIRHNKPLPVYGQGLNVRDWLYVGDHAEALELVFRSGQPGRTYNIGGFNERRNIDLVHEVIRAADSLLGRPEGTSEALITYVTDRPGHDLRYAIDSSRISSELGWKPRVTFAEGIRSTVQWYLDNREWLDGVTSGDYVNYYEKMYGK